MPSTLTPTGGGRRVPARLACGLTMMAGLIAQAYAQQPTAPTAPVDEATIQKVEVSGYRNSLILSLIHI